MPVVLFFYMDLESKTYFDITIKMEITTKYYKLNVLMI